MSEAGQELEAVQLFQVVHSHGQPLEAVSSREGGQGLQMVEGEVERAQVRQEGEVQGALELVVGQIQLDQTSGARETLQMTDAVRGQDETTKQGPVEVTSGLGGRQEVAQVQPASLGHCQTLQLMAQCLQALNDLGHVALDELQNGAASEVGNVQGALQASAVQSHVVDVAQKGEEEVQVQLGFVVHVTAVITEIPFEADQQSLVNAGRQAEGGRVHRTKGIHHRRNTALLAPAPPDPVAQLAHFMRGQIDRWLSHGVGNFI